MQDIGAGNKRHQSRRQQHRKPGHDMGSLPEPVKQSDHHH
jgi:hypothetical protein